MSLVIDMSVTPVGLVRIGNGRSCKVDWCCSDLGGESVGDHWLVERGSRGQPFLGVLPAEGLVDVHEHLLLALGQALVRENRRDHLWATAARLEDSGPHVKLLSRDAKSFGDLLQDVCAWLAQPSLDLGEVRVRDAGETSQLAQRNLGLLALLTDEFSDRGAG